MTSPPRRPQERLDETCASTLNRSCSTYSGTQKRSPPRRRNHERLHRARPAYKPGSVGQCRPDGHSSRIVIAHDLEQPTRGVSDETGHLSPPIRPCSDRGLPCRTCCQMRGGLLPHRFTLTGNNPPAVCFLWHFPSLQRSAQPLAGGPPYGARTFLGEIALPRPSGRFRSNGKILAPGVSRHSQPK